MKSKYLALSLSLILFGCSTAELDTAAKIAVPLAETAAVAAGAFYGVPPSASTAVIGGFNSLWGAYQQAQAGQPVSQGAVSDSVGKAIQQATAGLTQTQTITALQAAATLLQSQAPAAATVNMWPGAGTSTRQSRQRAEIHRRLVRDSRP